MTNNREYLHNIAAELEAIHNGEVTNDNGDEMRLYDYFVDALDFEYTVDSRKEYRSVKVWLTLGGPTVWLDTSDSTLHLAWGSEREEYPLARSVNTEVDNIFAEYFAC